MSIISVVTRAPGAIIEATKKGIAASWKFLASYAVEGYSASAVYTMPEHEAMPDNIKATNKHGLWVNLLASIIYIPGLIAGATVIPFVYLNLANFNRFRKWPNDRIEYYLKKTHRRGTLQSIKYAAGSLTISKIFGIIGAPLGLILGTTFAPALYKGLFLETIRSFYNIWGKIGLELARTDEQITDAVRNVMTYPHLYEQSEAPALQNSSTIEKLKQVFKPISNDDRSTLAKILGYVPFGIPLSIVSFTVTLTAVTLARVFVNSWYSLGDSFSFVINKSLFETRGLKLESLAPKNRNYYKHIIGFPGLVIGSAVGLGIGSVIIGIRIVYESALNFLKWASKGFHVPLSDLPGHRPYMFDFKPHELQPTNLKSITKAFNLTWSENLLGAPGYLLAPVAATLGFLTGSASRIARESLASTFNTSVTIISRTALKGVKGYKQPYFVENRKWYERAIGVLGYPVGLITLPFAAVILSVRYIITNYDTANRSFYYLSSPIIKQKTENATEDKRPNWVKALSAPGAVLGGTLGSIVRISGESVYTGKQLVKKAIKGALTDAPEEIKSHRLLDTHVKQPSSTTNYWGIPGSVIGLFITIPTVTLIIIGRLFLTNGTSFKREFAKQVNPKISKKERKIIVTDHDERSYRLQRAGAPGQALGFVFGKLGIVTVDSWAYLEYSIMKGMKFAAHQHPLDEKIELNPNINNHSAWTGAPGLVVGSIAAAIAASVFITGRVLYNTADSIRHVTLDMVKFVTHKGNDFPESQEFVMLSRLRNSAAQGSREDDSDEQKIVLNGDWYVSNSRQNSSTTNKKNTRRDNRLQTPFRLGALGIPLGGIVGLVATSIVGSLRFIAQSTLTAWNVGLKITRQSLPSNAAFNIDQSLQAKQASKVDKVMGALGAIPGLALGVAGFVIVGSLRTIVDTIITTGFAAYQIATLPPVAEYLPPLEDTREATDKRLGALGYVLAAPLGLVLYTLHITAHVVINSIRTGRTNLEKMILWSLGEEKYLLGVDPHNNHQIDNNDQRSFKEKHIFGIFGHIVGGAIGIAVDSVIITSRMLWHSLVRSSILGFKQFTNLARTKEMRILNVTPYANEANKIALPMVKRPVSIPVNILNSLKYISGLPGLAIGAVFSAVFWIIPNYAYVTLKENINSYSHLAKSLLNLGGEALYFRKGGLGQDDRPLHRKIIGTPGYLLAVATAGLVPLINGVGKLVLGCIGVFVIAPITGIYRAINAKRTNQSSDHTASDYSSVAIYESNASTVGDNPFKLQNLDKARELRAKLYLGEIDASLEMHRTYLGYFCNSLRSCMSLGQSSYTEALIDAKIADLTQQLNPDNTRRTPVTKSREYDRTIQSIKTEAHATHIPVTKVRDKYNADIDAEIERTKDWIYDYIYEVGDTRSNPKKAYTRNTLLFFKGDDSPDGRIKEDTKKDDFEILAATMI